MEIISVQSVMSDGYGWCDKFSKMGGIQIHSCLQGKLYISFEEF